MRNRCGIVLMVLGVLLLASAVSLTCLNVIEEKRAGILSEQTAAVLHEQIPNYSSSEDGNRGEITPETTATEMQILKFDGQDYIGILDIPMLDLSLPVLNDWNYQLLKLSPCRYSGSFLDNSMIIAGHNYRRHFGSLHQLQYGDKVIFTDVTGGVYKYEVVSVETLEKTDVKDMELGDWDLTLFTCTPGGTSRVTIRCKLQNISPSLHNCPPPL